MGKTCFFHKCKATPEKNPDRVFVPFVKPYMDIQRCKRWIQLSGRFVEVDRISKNTYLCSDHFGLNEVLNWKQNKNLEPIPLYRLVEWYKNDKIP